MKYSIYIGMLALCFGICLTSCSDDDDYDFTGDKYNRVYLKNNESSYKIVQTPISTVSSVEYETVVQCTRLADGDIMATVEVDNSLIDAYNSANETEYEAMPSNAIDIENTTLTIPADASVSADTLRLTLTEDQDILGTLTSEKGYLIPLTLTSASGNDAYVSSNIYYTYVIVTVTEDNVNHDATESDITGTLVEDQSGWTATTNGTVSSYYGGGVLTSMFDGNGANYVYFYASTDLTLDVDMGQEYTFDAIYMMYSYTSYYGTYTYDCFSSGMTVSISDDGETWSQQGEAESSGTFIAFYAPLTTRYIRITKPFSFYRATMYVGIFNVYAIN